MVKTMKLLFCPQCHDVHGLIEQEWRMCLCGQSGGQYNIDGMTATVGGQARVFGVGNPFFEYLYPFLEEKGKRAMWKKYYGHEMGDCWWGEYEGDIQILRVEDPKGPCLKIKVENLKVAGPDRIPTESGTNLITVIDKRRYQFLGQWHPGQPVSFQCPANARVKITRWDKSKKNKKEKKKDIYCIECSDLIGGKPIVVRGETYCKNCKGPSDMESS